MAEMSTTKFDIIRLYMVADFVAYTIILAIKIKMLEINTYYGILLMRETLKFKNSNPNK